MSATRLLCLAVGFFMMPAIAAADMIAADNLIYEPFQYSNFRQDVGYENTVNGGFQNTAVAQPFVSLASGPLKSISSLICYEVGGDPLQVSIYEQTGLGLGTKLGMVEFPQATFPSNYFTNPPTVLDMEGSGVQLVTGESYFVVFTTQTPVHATERYSMHVMPPTAKSFGMEYWFSRDSVSYSPLDTGDYELPILVTVAPEPSALLLLAIGGATFVGGFLIARRSRGR